MNRLLLESHYNRVACNIKGEPPSFSTENDEPERVPAAGRSSASTRTTRSARDSQRPVMYPPARSTRLSSRNRRRQSATSQIQAFTPRAPETQHRIASPSPSRVQPEIPASQPNADDDDDGNENLEAARDYEEPSEDRPRAGLLLLPERKVRETCMSAAEIKSYGINKVLEVRNLHNQRGLIKLKVYFHPRNIIFFIEAFEIEEFEDGLLRLKDYFQSVAMADEKRYTSIQRSKYTRELLLKAHPEVLGCDEPPNQS